MATSTWPSRDDGTIVAHLEARIIGEAEEDHQDSKGNGHEGHGSAPLPHLDAAHAAAAVEVDDRQGQRRLLTRIVETVRCFGDLGFTAFGGPGVHVVILRKRFVERKAWLGERTFVDLFTLGNALPGPGSTQLAFSIATVRNGPLCGLLAFLMWSLPGALAMGAFGVGVGHFPQRLPSIVTALFTGINASAVGLIALAAYQLSLNAITDQLTRALVVFSASFGICYHAPWMYPVLIVVGGLSTLVFDSRASIKISLDDRIRHRRRRHGHLNQATGQEEIELPSIGSTTVGPTSESLRRRRLDLAPTTAVPAAQRAHHDDASHSDDALPLRVPSPLLAASFGLALAVLFIVCLVVRSKVGHPTPPRLLDFFCNMLIAGLIIFGGGPVVIPLLRNYTVENGWVLSRDFLLGFALLQAMPGPNFNYAVYLGVLACPHQAAWGAVLGWFGIFSPGILLKLALLPMYNEWRKVYWVKSILRGLNAAAVGLVFTAVWQLFQVGYVHQSPSGSGQGTVSAPLTSDPWWGVVAAWSFVVTQWFGVPAALTILLWGAPAGLAWYGVAGRHQV